MEHKGLGDYKHSVTKHSGLGIASFAIAITTGLILFFLVATAGFLEVTTPGGIDENSPAAVLMGLALFGGLLLDMLGLALGVAGICQRDRSKLFAVLGVVISSAVLFGALLLIIVGLNVD